MSTDPVLVKIPEALTTDRLVLRLPQSGNGLAIYEAVQESLPQLREFPASLPWALGEQSPKLSKDFCQTAHTNFICRKDFSYMILDRKTESFIGCAGIHRVDWKVPKCEIGYWCRTSMTGKGYITEAVRCLTRLAFEEFKAARVEIIVDDLNPSAWRVCERLGFHLEGTHRRERRSPDGTLRDTRVYAAYGIGHNMQFDTDGRGHRSI